MKKLANKYFLTIMFFLIFSINTSLSPIFSHSRFSRIWGLWFVIFSTFTMFANEYLANHAKVNISKRKLKVTAGIVSLIIILVVFLFFGFWTDWSYL